MQCDVQLTPTGSPFVCSSIGRVKLAPFSNHHIFGSLVHFKEQSSHFRMICCNWKTVWIKFSSSSWREKGKWPKHTDLSSVAMSRKQMLHLHLLRSPNGCSHFISPSLLLLPHWTSSLSLPLSSSQFYLPPQTLRGVLPPSSSLLGLLLAPNPPLPPSPSDISPCSLLPSELQKGTFIRGLQIPPYLYLATVLFFFLSR